MSDAEENLIPSSQVLRNIDARNPNAVTIANPYGEPLPDQVLEEEDARALVEQKLNGWVSADCTEPIRNAKGESIRLGFS